jgi:hypothetical protein
VHQPSWVYESFAHDCSADGAIVVGEGTDGFGGTQAFVWRESTGAARVLPDIPGSLFATARVLNVEQGTILGLAADRTATVHTVSWGLDAGGPTDLLEPVAGLVVVPRRARVRSGALDVLATAAPQGKPWFPVEWRLGDAPERVPVPPEFGFVDVLDSARDGTLVGTARPSTNRTVAFVQRPDGALVRLPSPAGFDAGASGIAQDAGRIAGVTWKGLEQHACIWERDPTTGAYVFVDLAGLLAAHGALGSWLLFSTSDLSADGVVLTGVGFDPAHGYIEGWVATVPRP